jgi:hypothetical protein
MGTKAFPKDPVPPVTKIVDSLSIFSLIFNLYGFYAVSVLIRFSLVYLNIKRNKNVRASDIGMDVVS